MKKQTLKQAGVDYKSDAIMFDARAQWDLTDQFSFDVHGGLLGTNGFSEKNYSLGAGFNFNVIDNVQVGLGYNFSGFTDKDLDPNGFNAQGMYVGLQLKADEALFGWLSDNEPKLINAFCEPNSQIELTDADMLEKQWNQAEACRKAKMRGAPALDPNTMLDPDNKNTQ